MLVTAVVVALSSPEKCILTHPISVPLEWYGLSESLPIRYSHLVVHTVVKEFMFWDQGTESCSVVVPVIRYRVLDFF